MIPFSYRRPGVRPGLLSRPCARAQFLAALSFRSTVGSDLDAHHWLTGGALGRTNSSTCCVKLTRPLRPPADPEKHVRPNNRRFHLCSLFERVQRLLSDGHGVPGNWRIMCTAASIDDRILPLTREDPEFDHLSTTLRTCSFGGVLDWFCSVNNNCMQSCQSFSD
jgi:hypothetical protein